jgi:hypothetical protein
MRVEYGQRAASGPPYLDRTLTTNYWSSYYPCKSPRNVIAATATID